MATGEGLSAVVGVGLAARETTQRDPITLSEAFKEAFTLRAFAARLDLALAWTPFAEAPIMERECVL